ncbi:hypothetical protein AB0B30_37370 [Streptomyces narbonensis]|uniref:HTH marR-type domain-containing protein n=1 Tax=Streptomyces narbonensis TaxID=67333 RepID=A0ABV3CNE4_9ACTN
MTAQHYVSRARDLADRRRTLLTLTAEGRELHASLEAAAEKINAELLAVFPDELRGEVLRVLARISQR